jgi:hypothetical protein
MHQRTAAILDELRTAPWFSRVGIQDTVSAIVLPSWREAIAHCDTLDWENLQLDMSNEYRSRLAEQSKERRAKWNDIVVDLKKTLIPLVHCKIETVAREHRLPKVFEDSVQWDVLHACMEMEYADVYPPGFYANLASWYIKGHFLCGWQGIFPEGMLIIY